MAVSPLVFDRAFEVWQEFGLERGRPVEQRWAERVPKLAPAQYRAVSERCQAVERRALELAERYLAGEIAQAEAVDCLALDFPELTEKRVSRAGSQGFYFAMK